MTDHKGDSISFQSPVDEYSGPVARHSGLLASSREHVRHVQQVIWSILQRSCKLKWSKLSTFDPKHEVADPIPRTLLNTFCFAAVKSGMSAAFTISRQYASGNACAV